MQHSDLSPLRYTSVTLRTTTRLRLKQGVATMVDRGVRFSEQRLMRECLRIALQFWRGHGDMARRNRRYNSKVGAYEIVPFCTTESLRSVTWVRCHHSGISLSRLMDFAVRYYLQRVLEQWLSVPYAHRASFDVQAWGRKLTKRNRNSQFTISYVIQTQEHAKDRLSFTEEMLFQPWPPDFRSSLAGFLS